MVAWLTDRARQPVLSTLTMVGALDRAVSRLEREYKPRRARP